VVGLSAGKNVSLLTKQIERFNPRIVCIGDEEGAEQLRTSFPTLDLLVGEEGLEKLAMLAEVDLVVNALVGSIGLPPTLAALSLGRTVALANKESLVIGGELVNALLQRHGGTLLPIDSEHNALFQCLRGGKLSEVKRVFITASGGPFLQTPIEELAYVRPEEALSHPNWAMGSRITIDSATMVNKGFEVIEAHYLFSLPYERIEAIIHPESVIHSLVEYQDGSILAELAASDMRIPIQYVLTYPERIETGLPRLDLSTVATMGFEPLDPDRYPAFGVVLAAAKESGTALAAINAADEILVIRFLAGEIPFIGIASGLREILVRWRTVETQRKEGKVTLRSLLTVDQWARVEAADLPF
jgi:1-deoxy-D-xylulose-5-phosphate reductoisomerase